MAIVGIISDTQAPFHHPRTLNHLLRVRDKYAKLYPNKPMKWVHIGDELDFKFLKFASVNDPYTCEKQHELSLKFLRSLYREFPIVDVCHSNHVRDRIDYAAEAGKIPSFMLKPIRELLEAPASWRWADSWEIDGVRYEHGHRYKGVRPHFNALNHTWQSVVMGHHPRFGVEYKMVKGKMYFGMCVGALTLSDKDKSKLSFGMKYSKKYPTEMPLGCAVVVDGKHAFLEALTR